jgi:hypothetical protein
MGAPICRQTSALRDPEQCHRRTPERLPMPTVSHHVGNRCEFGNVCLGHTHGHHNRSEESASRSHHRHVCAVGRLLSHQACLRQRPRRHERRVDILLLVRERRWQLCGFPGCSEDSNAQLADPSWVRNSLPVGGVWAECILLHSHSWPCVSWRHFELAHAAVTRDVLTGSRFNPLPQCCRSPKGHGIYCASNK